MRKYHRFSSQLAGKDSSEKAGLQPRTKAYLKKLKYLFIFSSFALLSFFISANVYASSYELLFNQDLPIVSSLTKFSYRDLLVSLERDNSSVGQPLTGFVGDNGEPKELRLPQPEAKLALVPAVKSIQGDFLVRASTGHFFMTAPAKDGTLADVVVYAKRDWRSLPTNAGISIDDNIFLDTTKDWRYVYRIVEAVEGDQASRYVMPTSRRSGIILVIEGPNGAEIYRGENISLQNVGH